MHSFTTLSRISSTEMTDTTESVFSFASNRLNSNLQLADAVPATVSLETMRDLVNRKNTPIGCSYDILNNKY